MSENFDSVKFTARVVELFYKSLLGPITDEQSFIPEISDEVSSFVRTIEREVEDAASRLDLNKASSEIERAETLVPPPEDDLPF